MERCFKHRSFTNINKGKDIVFNEPDTKITNDCEPNLAHQKVMTKVTDIVKGFKDEILGKVNDFKYTGQMIPQAIGL